MHFMGGSLDLHPSTFVTRKGYKFLEGEVEQPTIEQKVNISRNVEGSNIGNHCSVSNYYGFSIDDFKILLNEINDPQDKEEASGLFQIIEKESATLVILQKFDSS